MKNFLLLSCLVLFISFTLHAEIVNENFDNWSDGSYGTVSTSSAGTQTTGVWETFNTICGNSAKAVGGTGRAITFNDDSGANEYLLYKGLDGNGKDEGIGTISFEYRHWDADGSAVSFIVEYNAGGGWIQVGAQTSVTSTTYASFSEVVNIAGNDIQVRVSAVEDAERTLIDNFEITNFVSGNPIVGFASSTDSDSEGSAGVNSSITVPVTMNMAPSSDVTVSINSTDGTATTADNDYLAISTSLTFTAAETYPNTKDITLTIVGDDTPEPNEDLTLSLSITSGVADAGASTYTFTILNDDASPLVINELLADPDATTGDANGDGTVSTTNDEFVEIYNTGSTDIDISGYTISDNNSVKHVFDAGTILAAGDNVVVFGGGTPMRSATTLLTASSGSLGLNNGGDAVTLADNNGSTITTVSYGSEGGNNQSLARNPDFTGALVQHSTIGTNPVDFSPGALNEVAVLPVELSSFTAQTVGRNVLTSWQTTQELNNSHFEIQHSTDKRNFTTIGKEAGAGNSDVKVDYNFTHPTPANGINYYRLQQFDFDGQSEYSQVVSVHFGKETGIAVYPNPVQAEVTIALGEEFETNAIVEIVSQDGSIVLSEIFSTKSFTQTINVSNLPTGVYVLRVVNGNEVYTERFVKK